MFVMFPNGLFKQASIMCKWDETDSKNFQVRYWAPVLQDFNPIEHWTYRSYH